MSTVVPNYAVHNLGALHRAPRRTRRGLQLRCRLACGALSRAPVSEAAYPCPSARPRYETW